MRIPTLRHRHDPRLDPWLAVSVGALLMAGTLNSAYGQSRLSEPPPLPSGTDMPITSPGDPGLRQGNGSGSSGGTGSGAGGGGADSFDNALNSLTPRRPNVPFTSTSYGKPRKQPDKRLNYKGRPKVSTRPLPILVPYAGSPPAKRPVDPIASPPPPPPNYAQQPGIPRKRVPVVDPTPYAPLGINVGSLRLTPFVEVSGGYDTNPNRTADVNAPRGSSVARIDAGVQAQSNWSAHELRADIRGGFARYTATPEANRPDGAGTINLRVDALRDTTLNFELRGALTTQRPGTPGLPTSLQSRPMIATFGASSGVTQKYGRLEATVTALADRTQYQDGRLNNGTTVPLSDNSYNTYGLRGRLAYEVTPGLIPFTEVTVDTRDRDKPIDGAGFARNSTGLNARIGSTFEVSRILTGQISGGYAQRKYEDSRLPVLNGPAIDASLIWTATPLTTVTLRGSTDFFETTLANASGAISRRGSLEISHALMRNVTVGLTASLTNNQYRGVSLSENYYTAGLKAEYNLTRSIVVKGSYTYERLKSSLVGSDYTANVFLLGLRLQR